MPRFGKLRDGCDWMWTDVYRAEEMIESFARSIQREDMPRVPLDVIIERIKVNRFHESDPLAGEVSRLEYHEGRHYWVATRELP